MNLDGFHLCDQPRSYKPSTAGGVQRPSDVITHLALALLRHVRELHHGGIPVPGEIEELAACLAHFARSRPDTTLLDEFDRETHGAGTAGQLLVTKAEAARRLGVSVRTIERLVAAGQLPMVHVERAARLRVSDLEAYARNPAEGGAARSDSNHPP